MELTRPFAEDGERQDFAIETQGNGEMSLQQGFGPLYSQAPESGGLFIDRAKFNQLMYLTTKDIIDNNKYIEALKDGTKTPLGMVSQIQKSIVYNLGDGETDDFKDLDTAFKFLSNKVSAYNNNNITINIKKNTQIPSGIFKFNFTLRLIGQGSNNQYKLSLNDNIQINSFIFASNLTYEFISKVTINIFEGYFWISGNIINNKLEDDFLCNCLGNGFVNFQSCNFNGTNSKILKVGVGGRGLITQMLGGTIMANVENGGHLTLLSNNNNTINTNIAKNTLTSDGIVYYKE